MTRPSLSAPSETQETQQTADISKKRKRAGRRQKARTGELEKLTQKSARTCLPLGKLRDARYERPGRAVCQSSRTPSMRKNHGTGKRLIPAASRAGNLRRSLLHLIDKYEEFRHFDKYHAQREFVEKICPERARKGSQDTTQEVEIYFNFVGRYIPPALQPVPDSREEQVMNWLRKKEETQGQASPDPHCRRKANGKQKEWEERWQRSAKQKWRRQRQLSAEDMESRAFTPSAIDPGREPRKAFPVSPAPQFNHHSAKENEHERIDLHRCGDYYIPDPETFRAAEAPSIS